MSHYMADERGAKRRIKKKKKGEKKKKSGACTSSPLPLAPTTHIDPNISIGKDSSADAAVYATATSTTLSNLEED